MRPDHPHTHQQKSVGRVRRVIDRHGPCITPQAACSPVSTIAWRRSVSSVQAMAVRAPRAWSTRRTVKVQAVEQLTAEELEVSPLSHGGGDQPFVILPASQWSGEGVSAWVASLSPPTQVAIQERDRPLVIDFFATWCGPCVLLASELEKVRTCATFATRVHHCVLGCLTLRGVFPVSVGGRGARRQGADRES
jgi:thiol-disulfide isomerase/thioredoxin